MRLYSTTIILFGKRDNIPPEGWKRIIVVE
jgi:hypothetical protein